MMFDKQKIPHNEVLETSFYPRDRARAQVIHPVCKILDSEHAHAKNSLTE